MLTKKLSKTIAILALSSVIANAKTECEVYADTVEHIALLKVNNWSIDDAKKNMTIKAISSGVMPNGLITLLELIDSVYAETAPVAEIRTKYKIMCLMADEDTPKWES